MVCVEELFVNITNYAYTSEEGFCRVDMQTAYEILHKEEIIPAAMAYAAQTTERKLAEKLRSEGIRPAENGVSQAGAVSIGSRVSQMSRKEIADLCRRVERGEKVSFG